MEPASLGGITWSLTSENEGGEEFYQWHDGSVVAWAGEAFQVGMNSWSAGGVYMPTRILLSTEDFGTVKSVKIRATTYDENTVVITVKAGNTVLGTQDYQDGVREYEFTGNGSGRLEIEFTQGPGGYLIFLNEITVVYTK